MKELNDEEMLQQSAPQELSDDEMLQQTAKPVKPPRELNDAEMLQHSEASFLSALGASFPQGVRKGVGGAMEALGDDQSDGTGTLLGNIRTQGITPVDAVFGAANYARKKIVDAVAPGLSEAGKELADDADFQQQLSTPDDFNRAQRIALTIGNSAGQMLPWYLAGRAGLRPAFITPAVYTQFAGQTLGQTYHEAKTRGASPSDALAEAIPAALAEIVGEKFGLDTLLKGGNTWMKKFIAQEIGGEEFTTVIQSLAEKRYSNPEKWSSSGEIVTDLTDTALAAAGGAGLIGGVGKGLDFVQRRKADALAEDVLLGFENDLQRENYEDTEAGKSIQTILQKIAAGLEDVNTAPLPPIEEPTGEELAIAELVRQQKAQGLAVPRQDTVFTQNLQGALNDLLDSGVVQDEGGITPYVEGKRRERFVEADTPATEWVIQASRDERVIGLNMGQLGELPAGGVVAIRPPNVDPALYPKETFAALVQAYGRWMDKYLPNSRIVLNLAPFNPDTAGEAYGLHTTMSDEKGLVHIITPREMPNIGKHGVSDPRTTIGFIGGASHEFGHAVSEQGLYESLAETTPAPLLQKLTNEIRKGKISPETLQQVMAASPEEGAMIATWQELRQGVLEGKVLATEFLEQWGGLRKLGSSVAKQKTMNKSLYTWAEDRAAKAGLPLHGLSAMELLAGKKLKNITKEDKAEVHRLLGLSEYMAEQYSRAVYTRGDLASSRLGKLFAETLGKLRSLFRELKTVDGELGTSIIPPQTTFSAWLDKMTIRAGKVTVAKGKFQLSKEIQRKQKELVANIDKQLAELLPEIVPEVPPKGQVPPPKEVTIGQAKTQEEMLARVQEMLDSGILENEKRDHRLIRGMITRGQYLEAWEKMDDLLYKNTNWDREYSSKVLEKLPNKPMIKAETLRAVLKHEGIKQKEKDFYEMVLASTVGQVPREEIARQIQEMGEKTMLRSHIVTGIHPELDGMGARNIGYPEDLIQSRIWERPYQTEGSIHWEDSKGYFAHTRFIDIAYGRSFLEIQSDYARNAPAVYNQLERVDWLKATVQEELQQAMEDGMDTLYFPTGETAIKLQGWPMQTRLEELSGKDYVPADEFVPQMPEGTVYTGDIEIVPGETSFIMARILLPNGQTRMVEVFTDTLKNSDFLQQTPKDQMLGDYAGGYRIYEKDLKKVLTELCGKVRVMTERSGHTWWAVSTRDAGTKTYLWDNDNPLQPSMPQVTLADFAGMSVEDYRNPEVIAQAAGMWERLKFDSPFFQRWGGQTKVLGVDGKPLGVWRGANNRVTFLDKTTRGMHTGAKSAKKAFWFAENKANADWYAQSSILGKKQTLTGEGRRQAQTLRVKIEKINSLLEAMPRSDSRRNLVARRKLSLQNELTNLTENAGMTVATSPVTQEFYLNMENPLIVDAEGQGYSDQLYTLYLDSALAGGHDGLIIKNTFDPKEGTVYAVFEPEQVKATGNVGTFDATDELHWDQDSQNQQTVRGVSKFMQNFWEKGQLRILNTTAKAVDSMMQLQQVAAGQPDDYALNLFVKFIGRSQQMKNNLQYRAEELGRKMAGMAPKTIRELHRALRVEWQSGALASTLVGKDNEGNVVWGSEVGTSKENQALVVNWEVADSPGLRAFFQKQGIDVTTPVGKDILDTYLGVRNVFLHQFKGLEITLRDKAESSFGDSPAAMKAELWKIDQLMAKLRQSPFMPRGDFGKYVLIVQKDQGKENGGFVTVRRQHFENKADWQKANAQWQRAKRGDVTLKVSSQILDDSPGVPMQLPRELMENLALTGEYTDKQLELMSSLMLKAKYEKLDARYEKIGEKTEGWNEDFMRVFAGFTWHNANFIWKMYYRAAMQNTIAQANAEVRRLERASDLPVEEQLAKVDRQRRNISLMKNSLDYMLNPAKEFQAAKTWITMVYLAYNVKTAMMNLSTQLNTMAALTSEYGEGTGIKLYTQALRDTASVQGFLNRAEKETNPKEKARLYELHSVVDKALRDGVLDQSYAYFLAGQANTAGALRATSNSWIGKTSHALMETGMLPFRITEKLNRKVTLLGFYQAERGRGASPSQAYDTAVQQTNLLQNSYDSGNKPELLRGKKSILMMFASYTQFQGWIMSGGYERAMRAQARSSGRNVVPMWRGVTVKLWLLYALFGGLLGVPFAQNAMDVLQFIWRKFFGKTENIADEMRNLVKDLGGNPNVVMHGLLHNAGGFDLSGSFGLGRLIPGTDLLNRQTRNVEEFIGRGVLGFSGPAGGFYADMTKALSGFIQGNWLEGFKEFPGAGGAVAKTVDAILLQSTNPGQGVGVTTRTGERLTFDPVLGDFRDLTTAELAGMALGATTNLVSQNREERYAKVSEMIYWQTRRADLMDKYWKSVRTGDDELRDDTREVISFYNENLPDNSLRITGKDLAVSVRTRRKLLQEAEINGVSQKKYQGLARGIGEGFTP